MTIRPEHAVTNFDKDAGDLHFDPNAICRYILFSTMHGPYSHWFMQTPGGDGIWAESGFITNQHDERATWLVVCDEPEADLTTVVPRERRILFLGEPTAYKQYPLHYLEQFGIVVGPTQFDGYGGDQLLQQPALPWHFCKPRHMSWRELASDKEKNACISVFCSSKTFTPQQIRRIAFTDALEKRLGSRLARFGHGFQSIAVKADGIAPFRYHIVLENNLEANFWTEKLGDAFLGHSFPIRAGGFVSSSDFDPNSIAAIDISDFGKALDSVEKLVEL